MGRALNEGHEDHRQAETGTGNTVAHCEAKTSCGPSLVVIDISGAPHNNLTLHFFLLLLLLSSLPLSPNSLLHSHLSMEEAQNSEQTHIPIPAFPSKPDIIASVPHIPTGDDSLRRPPHRRRRSRDQPTTTTSRKKTKTTKMIKEEDSSDDDDQKVAVEEEDHEEEEEEDREEIERKIEALQRIVPGGESLGMDKLFDETADYIMALQYQIKGLRALSSLFERLEKDKSKLGG